VTDVADPIRVLLVDADPMQREGWRLVIDAQPDMVAVEEAGDGVSALAVLRKVVVDVAVVDARLPRMSGMQVVERILADARVRLVQRPPVTRVVLVTATDLDRFVPLGVEAGAHAVLYKDTPPDALLATLRAAAALRRTPAA
jgi:DNA-binding NarL/FixJ family response regulator